MKILIKSNLEKYIKKHNWSSSMYDLIGKEFDVSSVRTYDYQIFYNGMWFIPKNCAEIVDDDSLKIKWYKKGKLEENSNNWWDLDLEDSLYLSEDQELVHQNGLPLHKSWIGKNLVLFEKNNEYFVIGEIRYTQTDFFMFYEYNRSIESENFIKYKKEIKRRLNLKEKEMVMNTLFKRYKFPNSLLGNSEKYIDIVKKKFEDVLITDQPQHRVFRFGEYRKGSEEYGQLFQDLMMVLRLKKEQNKDADSIVLTRKDLKNMDYNKLVELIKDEKKMRKLGMTFDVKLVDGGIEFSNLGNKESRPWENNVNENLRRRLGRVKK